jgi:hypothetical protein
MVTQKKRPTTVGLTGAAGSGKDTVAEFLFRYWGFQQFALADAIKEGASEMLGIPLWMFHDRVYKERPVAPYGVSPRKLAQTLGTEWARNTIGEDTWIIRLDNDIDFVNANWRVVADVRFDNEVNWIRGLGGQVWRVNRNGMESVRPHVSENGVRDGNWDLVVDNTGDFDHLENSVRECVRLGLGLGLC